ncbi:MAG: hypothetical protein WCD76_12930 [Pyrinomonadaceae bacterium]
MRRIFLTLAACALTTLALSGCDNTAETNTNTVTTANTTKTTTTTTTTTSSGTSIGVASCDEYLAKMEKCMASPKVPEAAKAAYRNSLEQYRDQWKKAAATEAGKSAMAQGCQSALDSAKTFFASCE